MPVGHGKSQRHILLIACTVPFVRTHLDKYTHTTIVCRKPPEIARNLIEFMLYAHRMVIYLSFEHAIIPCGILDGHSRCGRSPPHTSSHTPVVVDISEWLVSAACFSCSCFLLQIKWTLFAPRIGINMLSLNRHTDVRRVCICEAVLGALAI